MNTLDTQKIFTDGAKSANGVAAAVSEAFFESVKLHRYASVYTAELTAVCLALEWAASEDTANVVILSDSLSTVTAIGGCMYQRHPLVCRALNAIHSMKTSGRVVALAWVPAHCGIAGNENADAKAREAVEQTCEELKTPITQTEAITRVNQEYRSVWNQRYTDAEEAAHFKKFFQTTYDWVSVRDMPRAHQTTLFRLQTGHCRLNAHLHRLGIVESPLCSNCGVIEDVVHFVLECPKYRQNRENLLHHCRSIPGTIQDKLKALLTNRDMMRTVGDFVLSTQREL